MRSVTSLGLGIRVSGKNAFKYMMDENYTLMDGGLYLKIAYIHFNGNKINHIDEMHPIYGLLNDEVSVYTLDEKSVREFSVGEFRKNFK